MSVSTKLVISKAESKTQLELSEFIKLLLKNISQLLPNAYISLTTDNLRHWKCYLKEKSLIKRRNNEGLNRLLSFFAEGFESDCRKILHDTTGAVTLSMGENKEAQELLSNLADLFTSQGLVVYYLAVDTDTRWLRYKIGEVTVVKEFEND